MLKSVLAVAVVLASSNAVAATYPNSFTATDAVAAANFNLKSGVPNYGYLNFTIGSGNGFFDLVGEFNSFDSSNQAKTLVSGHGFELYSVSMDKSFTSGLQNPGSNFYKFSFSNLSAGAYELRFNVESGGSISGSFMTTAVPEPESLSFLLAGLSLVGFLTKRKSRD